LFVCLFVCLIVCVVILFFDMCCYVLSKNSSIPREYTQCPASNSVILIHCIALHCGYSSNPRYCNSLSAIHGIALHSADNSICYPQKDLELGHKGCADHSIPLHGRILLSLSLSCVDFQLQP
jgi:hypothetical protein